MRAAIDQARDFTRSAAWGLPRSATWGPAQVSGGALLRSATCGAPAQVRDVGTLLRSAAWGLCPGPAACGLCSGPRRVALLRSATCGGSAQVRGVGDSAQVRGVGLPAQVSNVGGSAQVRGVGTLPGQRRAGLCSVPAWGRTSPRMSPRRQGLPGRRSPPSEVQSELIAELKSDMRNAGENNAPQDSRTLTESKRIVNGEVKQTVRLPAAQQAPPKGVRLYRKQVAVPL